MKRSSGATRDDLRVIVELNEQSWHRLRSALDDLEPGEVDWRPLPESNNINVIVRHLRIEAAWHLDSLTRGRKMPGGDVSGAMRKRIDAVALDFDSNMNALNRLSRRFVDALRATTRPRLQLRTTAAYGAVVRERAVPHLLGYHQALHVAAHVGQIQMIRNLYRKTRGEAARFFPDNPTYPR